MMNDPNLFYFTFVVRFFSIEEAKFVNGDQGGCDRQFHSSSSESDEDESRSNYGSF